MTKINLHDVVALKEEMRTQRFPFGGEILLPEGLVGTVVVEHVPGEVFEVEFSGNDGEAFAMLTIEVEKLFLLHFELAEMAAAS